MTGARPEHPAVIRRSVDVDGRAASYLSAGAGPLVLMLHGTYWSRVWLPVLDRIAAAGVHAVAVDLPGCGRSAGSLDLDSAAVPALAAWTQRFVHALGPRSLAGVAGHDIGGAVAQHLAVASEIDVPRLALVNSVTYDSWPVPGVARFRDPAVAAATGVDEVVAARRAAVTAALHGAASESLVEEYLAPWHEARVARSWMALAGAADSRYTLDLLDRLRTERRPTLLVWGEEDTFQPLRYAQRLVAELPDARLRPIADAGHIPMENDPERVGRALGEFFG